MENLTELNKQIKTHYDKKNEREQKVLDAKRQDFEIINLKRANEVVNMGNENPEERENTLNNYIEIVSSEGEKIEKDN